MKTEPTPRHYIKLIRLFGITTIFSVLFFGANTVLAQSCGPVICNGATGSGKICTATAQLSCATGYLVGTYITATGGSNAICNNGMATHTVGQPSSASCSFMFKKICSSMSTIPPTSPSGVSTVNTYSYSLITTCNITKDADGLPVELMGFEIKD